MPIRVLLFFISVFYLAALASSERVRSALDGSDSWGHYVHLPALMLYHDTGDYSKTIAAWQQYYPNRPDPRQDAYGIRPTQTGQYAVKYPIGVALLESPFFLTAHAVALAMGKFPADGFCIPYAWAVALSSVFFSVLGLFFLFKNLRFYFSERISLFATATIGVATNLLFFASYTTGMAHPVAFCLIAYLLIATRRWHRTPNFKNSLKLGVTLGLIGLVRTQDLIAAVIPLFWGIRNWPDFAGRLGYFAIKGKAIGWALLAFCLTFLPQICYWKYTTGEYWHYGYQGEQFDWSNPRILDGLFSFQNGWLVYTPVMFLALWGLLRLRRHTPDFVLPLLIFLPLHWIISYSWWCWMYINGFGSRPMIDAYALLALPLAAWMASLKKRWMLLPVFLVFFALNVFQIWQTRRGIFWSERGNWAFYKEIFGKTKGSERALSAFESGEMQTPRSVKKIKTITQTAIPAITDTLAIQIEGKSALPCKGEFNQTQTLQNDSMRLQPGDWLRVSVTCFTAKDLPAQPTDYLAKLVVDFSNAEPKLLKYRAINICTHLGNPKYILWNTRGHGEWGEASFFVKVPKGFEADGVLKTYIWNPHGQEIFFHTMLVEQWH